jgi:hypothetical protein
MIIIAMKGRRLVIRLLGYLTNYRFPHKCPVSLATTTMTLHIYADNMDSLCQQAVQASSRALILLDNQFWGKRYGILIDPFGHQWSMSMGTKMSQEEMATKRKAIMSIFAKGEQRGKSN